jgi:phage tail-like protein
MPASDRNDPYRAYNFKLEITGVARGHFAACTGLGISVEAIRYREGGENQIVRRLPGPVEYGDITLHYGLTDSRELFEWMMTAVSGEVDRRDVSIIMLAENDNDEVLRWNLYDAWPSEWRGAALDALGREVAVEQLTLVCERIALG